MLQNVEMKRLVSVGVVRCGDGKRLVESSVVGEESERYTYVDKSVGSDETVYWFG